MVQVYLNKVLRYSVKANLYRGDTKANNGFYVAINKRFLSLRSNLIELRIIDTSHQLVSVVYKAYVRR